MSRKSLKSIADKDRWTWEEFQKAHAYNIGETVMEKRAVVNTDMEKQASQKLEEEYAKEKESSREEKRVRKHRSRLERPPK